MLRRDDDADCRRMFGADRLGGTQPFVGKRPLSRWGNRSSQSVYVPELTGADKAASSGPAA
jgi:hypothetical protein